MQIYVQPWSVKYLTFSEPRKSFSENLFFKNIKELYNKIKCTNNFLNCIQVNLLICPIYKNKYRNVPMPNRMKKYRNGNC